MTGSSKDSSSEDLTLPTTPTNTTQPTSAATSADLSTPPRAHGDASSNDNTPHTPGKIFVGGLSWETTDEGLRAYFSKYGEVADSVVMRDSSTSRSRGFGFVTFANVSVTDAVLAETHVLDGKTIDPKLAVPREFKPSPLGSDFRTKKLFVGGIAPATTEDSLRKYFGQFGTVTEALLMTDRETARPRGFGFVTFDNEDAAEQACQQKFHEIDHKANVEVKKAEPKSTRTRGESRTPTRQRASQPPATQEYAYYSPQQAATQAYPAGYSATSSNYGAYPTAYINAAYGYAAPSPAGRQPYASPSRPYRANYQYVAAGSYGGPPPPGARVYDEFYAPEMSPERPAGFAAYPAGYAPLTTGAYAQPMGFATPRPPRSYQTYVQRT